MDTPQYNGLLALVEPPGLEPGTSTLSVWRSNHLNYGSIYINHKCVITPNARTEFLPYLFNPFQYIDIINFTVRSHILHSWFGVISKELCRYYSYYALNETYSQLFKCWTLSILHPYDLHLTGIEESNLCFRHGVLKLRSNFQSDYLKENFVKS